MLPLEVAVEDLHPRAVAAVRGGEAAAEESAPRRLGRPPREERRRPGAAGAPAGEPGQAPPHRSSHFPLTEGEIERRSRRGSDWIRRLRRFAGEDEALLTGTE